MVDKAHSNPFSLFMRKIGFSVGLEHTLHRLEHFAQVYASSEVFSFSNVKRMLHDPPPDGWGLKDSNEHIIDVLRSLEVFSIKHGEFQAMETGDALGICARLKPASPALYSRFLFLQSLIRADGDVFLNGLVSRFEPDEFKGCMLRLVEFKRSVFEGLFKTQEQRNLIYRAINIEYQENNTGGKGNGGILGRAGSSPFAARASIFREVSAPEVTISDSYVKKALPRRKAWAISLGLAESDGSLTQDGERLLSEFSSAGYNGPSCVAMWPLRYEIDNSKFSNLAFPENVKYLETWDYLKLIRRGLGGRSDEQKIDADRCELGLRSLQIILNQYRSMNLNKSILRRELPIRIGYLVVLAMADYGDAIMPLPRIIELEQTQRTPVLMARPSRSAEFALFD